MTSIASRPVFLVLAAVFVLAAQAHTDGTGPTLIERFRERATPVGMLWDSTCGNNAALMVFKDSLSMYKAGISGNQSKCSRPVVAQEGAGQTRYQLVGEAYHRLSAENAIWGEAAYSQTSVRQNRFADIIDYQLVGPYTLGDDTGGNLRGQRYEIGGGWSRLSGRWSVGVEASYRAEIVHRSRDPRVKDIVSDLQMSVGASLKISPEWIVGINADFTTYNQDVDVDFMNPTNKIITQLYTGLGNVYKRFGGNTVTESSHSLMAFGFGFQLLPARRRGLITTISFNRAECDMYLRGYNNIKPAYTETINLEASVTLPLSVSDNIEVIPSAETVVSKRQGIENLFNTAAGGNYAVIGSRENYRHDVCNAVLRLPVRWHSIDNGLAIMFEPLVIAGIEKEQLLQPQRMIEVRHIIPGVAIDADRVFGKRTMVRVILGCNYRTTSGPKPELSGIEADSPEEAAVVSNYDMLSSRKLTLNAKATISRAIGRNMVNLNIDWSNECFRGLATNRCLGASLSINF